MLHAPRGIRPTSGQVVEAIFNILGQRLFDEDVLDLFAGSGALGLEALSRGAARATFVDKSAASVAAIRRNLDELGYSARGRPFKADAVNWVAAHPDEVGMTGLILIDPPYGDSALDQVLRLLDGPATVAGTFVVAEHEQGRKLPKLGRLHPYRERRYGDTALTILEAGA